MQGTRRGLGKVVQRSRMIEVRRCELQELEMPLALQQIEHRRRAGRAVDHESGMVIVRRVGDEAEHEGGDGA